jgi:hypothetical protein
MPIVTASVHLTVVSRAMLKCVKFLQRQGVHVGPQSKRAGTIPLAQHTHDPGAGHVSVNLYAPLTK